MILQMRQVVLLTCQLILLRDKLIIAAVQLTLNDDRLFLLTIDFSYFANQMDLLKKPKNFSD
jgi:hypothetical protein